MSDELNPEQPAASGEASPSEGWTTVPPASAGSRVGFCQDCGKPLTAETVRTVGTGVFCEPCLAARVGVPNPAAGYAGVPPVGAMPEAGVPVPAFSEASPVLAGFLGLIPGVGAMYNGQYSKGFAHLIIFVVLDSIQKNVNSVFGLFVVAWVCYQVFDAYHTAKARNEGLPLPNVFGLNDIGERMGFGKSSATGNASWSSAPKPPVSGWQAPPTYPAGGPVPSGPDWVGYVPPTNFAGAVPPLPPPVGYPTAHYSETFAGGAANTPYAASSPYAASNPYAAVPPVAPMASVVPPLAPARRFPMAAVWLIGLGLLILLANLLPDWKMSERWWTPLLLAGLAVWIFLKRLRTRRRLICILRAPVVLMALAIMFALHAAEIYINFGIVWAVLLIVFGALLVLERTLGASAMYVAPEIPRASFVPAPDYPTPPATPQPDDEATKGGL
jgi:hypothetical protein